MEWEPPPKASAERRPPPLPSALARLLPDGGAGRGQSAPYVADRTKMKLEMSKTRHFALAFGRRRLAQLTENAVVVRDTARWKEVVRLPLDSPRAVVALADGSFFACGAREAVRLLPHDTKAKRGKRLLLLPRSELFPDRAAPNALWVRSAGTALFRYDVESSDSFAPEEWIELEGFDRNLVGSLRDGSFVFSTAAGLSRVHGKGKAEPLLAVPPGVLRVLPGSRPDTAWLVGAKEASLQRIVGRKLDRVAGVTFAATVWDADAAGQWLGVLELEQPDGAPRSFVLEVFDTDGNRHFRAALPADESGTPDWVSRLTRDRHLSVSSEPPLVAVGGPGRLDVFRADKGEKIPTDG